MNNTRKIRIAVLLALLMSGLLSSCLKEDLSDCPRPFKLYIKAVDADEKDITESGDVQQAILFVFNENGQIVDAVSVTAEQVKSRKPIDIRLDYPGHKSLKFVVWANNTGVDFPQTASVKQLSELYVKLKSQNGTAQSPSDVFHGELDVPVETGGTEPAGDQTVTIRRKTAQVTIKAIGLKQWNQNKEGTYTFRLKESLDTYDQNGKLTGNKVNYLPVATMTDGTLTAPIFNTFPTDGGKSYALEILFNGEVIFTADKGSDGKAFIPEVGRLLNIIIDFRAQLNVIAVITPWGVVYQYVVI